MNSMIGVFSVTSMLLLVIVASECSADMVNVSHKVSFKYSIGMLCVIPAMLVEANLHPFAVSPPVMSTLIRNLYYLKPGEFTVTSVLCKC